MGTINHRHVTKLPDNPNADSSSDQWNDALVIRGTDADGFVLTRDATQPDGWRFAPLPTVDLSGVVPITRTVNAHPLSSDVVVTKGDVGLGNVENTALSTWSGSTSITTIGTLTDHLSIGTNPATSGAIRLDNSGGIYWNAGSGITVSGNNIQVDIPVGGYSFRPIIDDGIDLGYFAQRWRQGLFSQTVAIGTNPATTGAIRLANDQGIYVRNKDNTGDVWALLVNNNNDIVFGYGATNMLLYTNLIAQPDASYDIGY